MEDNLTFTVLIPTLNRADVLPAAIATCVRQSDPALEILVSDNASTDHTRAVVESYSDPRIRYINPGRQLGMPEHWEFALSHVRPGYVSVLGDDDGFLLDTVAHARAILRQHDVRAVAWRKAEYHWPDHILPGYRNWLQIPTRQGVEVFSSSSVLRDVLAFERTYTDLPCIYNSFVATEILDVIRHRGNGRLLPCITPDAYSGIAVAGVIDRYAFSWRPLSVNAASRHSNGTIASYRGVRDRDALKHFTSSSLDIHSQLARCSSVPVLIADAALAAKANLPIDGGWPTVDMEAMLRLAAHYAERRPAEVYEETMEALETIAYRNSLMPFWEQIRSRSVHVGVPELQSIGWNEEGDSLVIDGNIFNLRDVADAAACVALVLDALAGAPSPTAATHVNPRSATLNESLDPSRRLEWSKLADALLSSRPKVSRGRAHRYWRALRRRVAALITRTHGDNAA